MATVFKVTINNKHDHELYYDKIINVTSGKEFRTISEAHKDINGDYALLTHYLGIEFDVPNKGSISLQDLECNVVDDNNISSIHSYLCYLMRIKSSIETYRALTEFVQDVCYEGDEKFIAILDSLVLLRERN